MSLGDKISSMNTNREETDIAETVRIPNRKPGARSRKQVSWFRTGDAYLTAFFVPVLVMVIIFIQRGIFPFGENSFLRTDMYHQYAPFFSEFKNKLETGGSLLYTWDVGLGVNFSGLYAYYLASPFNWLIIFWPKNYIIEFMTCMIVFKIGLCGLTMAYYLNRHCKKDSFFTAFFAIFYALSAYMAAYSWNIMWLDCLWLFPLVCLGLERLVNRGKGWFYVITLGLCITSNYYISIMICMFMVIYCIALLVMRGKTRIGEFFKTAGKFAFFSLTAGGLSMGVLLPEIYALQATASGEFSFPKTFSSYFSVIDILARHMGNIDTEIGLDHWPNIYCGVAVYILILLFILNRKISLKEKSVYVTMLFIFFAGFSINVLNYIWHGFHYPNSLPARQSFIYIFLVLFMCCRAVDEWDGNSLKHLEIAFLVSIAFILLCQKFVDQKHFSFGVYYAALGFVSFYALMLYLYKSGKMGVNALMFTLLAAVSIESAVNTTITSVPTTSRTAYTEDNADVIKLTRSIKQDPFCRFDKVTSKTKDDGAWMNFHSASLFSSTARADLSAFFTQLGCEASVNAYSITGATPFVDALLDIKYGIYSEQPDNDRIKLIGSSGTTYLYENPSTFPIAFTVPSDMDENWAISQQNPADVQNDLCNLVGVSDVLVAIDGKTDANRFSFTPDKDGQYYVFCTNSKVDKVTAQLPEGNKTFENLKRIFFMELGSLKAGDDTVLLGGDSDQILNAKAYRFDYDALEQLKKRLAYNSLDISSFTDTHIAGTITVDNNNRVLMTSIPFDKGWTVKIDGQKVKTLNYLNALLAVKLLPGKHTVTMDFYPEGLKTGMMVSALSALLLIGVCLAAGKRNKRKKKKRAEYNLIFQEEEQDERNQENSPETAGKGIDESREEWAEETGSREENGEDREKNGEEDREGSAGTSVGREIPKETGQGGPGIQ